MEPCGFFVTLVAPLTILYAVYLLLKRNYKRWEKQNLPCFPDPTAGFGHMWSVISLRENIGSFVQKIYNSTDASVIGFYFVQRPSVLVRDPELVKSVLVTNFTSFRNNLITVSKKHDPVLSKNPFLTTEYEQWKTARARAINHFSSQKLRHLFVIVHEVSSKLVSYIERKIEDTETGLYECELKKLFLKFTGEIVANAAFGMEGQSFEDNPDELSFTKRSSTVFEPSFVNGIKQALLLYLPGVAEFFGTSMMMKKTDTFLRENLKKIIKERRQSNAVQNDFLQFCLDGNEEGDIDSIIADLIIFYVDTYETSSSAAASLFYFLATYKKVQEKLRDHLSGVLKESGGNLTYETLKSMNYLDQVTNESLRLIPPLGAIMKVCTEEITLEGSDGLKCHLKPGDPVFVPVMGLHMDPKHYAEPELFDPERFSPENTAKRNKCVFLPFGEGPRMCLGMRFANIMLKLVTSKLLSKFSVEYSSKTKEPFEFDPTTILTAVKGGLWVRFKKLDRSDR